MERVFEINNSSQATTAAPVKQPTGSAIRTMLQIEVPATAKLCIVEWGISFDGSAAATPIQCELLGATVAATMSTASVAADVTKLSDPDGLASNIVFGGTTHTGFATAAVTEGTIANYRSFDLQQIAPTGQYVKQWPLGREPMTPISSFIRVRVTAGASVGCYCYVVWSE